MDGLYLRCLICRFHWLVGSDCFFLVGVVVSPNCLGFGGFEYDHVSLRLTTLLPTATGTRASTSLLSRSITLLFSFLLLPFLPIFPESAKPSLLMPCGRKVLFLGLFLLFLMGNVTGGSVRSLGLNRLLSGHSCSYPKNIFSSPIKNFKWPYLRYS